MSVALSVGKKRVTIRRKAPSKKARRRSRRHPPRRVTILQASVAVVPHDPTADRGVVAFQGPDGDWLPLGAVDPERIAALRPHALAIAECLLQVPVPVTVVRFTTRIDVETLEDAAKLERLRAAIVADEWKRA